MTSISGSGVYAPPSPRDRMQAQLQSAISAGTVNASDQSALSTAIDDIDASLKASGPPSGAVSRDSMKTKVDGLIDKEVSNGALTSDQATELKSVFAQAAQKMGGHHHGARAASSTDDIIAALDATGSTATTDPSASSDAATSVAGSAHNAMQSLVDFLGQLRTALSANAAYGSNGAQASGLTSALVNAVA